METKDEALDIQAQVLQTTLQEITATRRASATNEKDGDGDGDGDNDEVAAPADDCCVVCLDSISEPCAAMPCGHSHFDFVCLVSWLQEHPNCPLCKAAIYKVRYVDSTTSNESFYRVLNAPRPRNKDDNSGSGNPALSNLLRQRRNDQRRRRDATHTTTPTPGEAIARRRHIYRHQLYSLHVGSNRISGYKPTPTPEQFATTPHLITRARLWIRRELQVFAFLSEHPEPEATSGPSSSSSASSSAADRELTRRRNNGEFLLEYIIAILKTVDIQGSAGQAEDMLADFLGRDHARLFLHELRSWLRSPAHSLVAWDKEVRYSEVSSRFGEGEMQVNGRKRKAQDSEDGRGGDEVEVRSHASGSERSRTPRWPERENHYRQTGHERIRRRMEFDRTPRSSRDGYPEETHRQTPG